jgi:sporulation protein YlmC with PRC-barrel domain
MEIPLNAQVVCSDGVCGRSMSVLINPVVEDVTHLVVKEDLSPNKEYIVPVDWVAETVANTIQLHCTKAEFKKLDPFIKTQFIEEKVPVRNFSATGMYGSSYYYIPYITPLLTVSVPVDIQQIPPGELAVQRGTRIEATDGFVGNVDEFVVNPTNYHITHLVMREGHLWGKKDVIIPISAIGDDHDDIVYLKLNKQQVEALPTFPVHRRWA